jgi:hypothetical protein
MGNPAAPVVPTTVWELFSLEELALVGADLTTPPHVVQLTRLQDLTLDKCGFGPNNVAPAHLLTTLGALTSLAISSPTSKAPMCLTGSSQCLARLKYVAFKDCNLVTLGSEISSVQAQTLLLPSNQLTDLGSVSRW